jgi:16S rRNA (cytidine1402-2'-O)-methyltransferase
LTESGTLFIVATPIGNLEDITLRALRILAEVDLIAAEDTRHSQRLLQHYDISTRLTSLHDHNESHRAKQLIEKLKQGENIALISDAGTPLISDPGYGFVSQCREAEVNVVPLPGPCAAITALCAAGLATDRFKFEGFLPVKTVAKQQALQRLLTESSTSVFYESPRRVTDTVKQIVTELGENRKMVIAKELTKTFETFYSGTALACLTWLEEDANHQRGEFVLMIAGEKQDQTEVSADALNLLKLLVKELPLKKAAGVTAEQFGLKKNQLYQLGLELNL